ncbi:tyrosyl-DNA phosphodiesterase domain-containing protein [Metarhizium acridum CQMa 102]|uniref:Tyrosyl-DNA phosphodiesterase domain-containing protein n=1 Tax=Metarhizium acridum (strain CQMa 102) TaxID=655827 RepID=E9DW95_METAQ|nr:tyrosyl-DNA phosphodiesterase domain-containing protein [Metarhizium acridum CQMa 102]EFY91945.1 tyrosyl-DNA phosphodiesterase domain-containing protein [Metarhizium acridum CQMa 102]
MAANEEQENKQLKSSITLPLQERTDKKDEDISRHSDIPQGIPPFSFGSLNRKKMEEERLARIATKRHRICDEEDAVQIPGPKRVAISAMNTNSKATVPFPRGTVKRTWARGYDRSPDDIKIEEVLQRDKLVLALISSFQWDEAWLLSKIDTSRTKVLLAAFARDDAQILKFADYLRIVIPSGNLVPHDWGETGVMENHYLRAMGVDNSMIDSLSRYDFSETDNIGFVYSMQYTVLVRAAGTICLQEKWWRASTFPTELMRDCVSTRDGLLLHTKIILVRQKISPEAGTNKKVAWAYVGSANLSESAWGRLVTDRASGQKKMMCRNWECGVVLPVRAFEQGSGPVDMNVFQGTIPIPMQVPGRRQGQGRRVRHKLWIHDMRRVMFSRACIEIGRTSIHDMEIADGYWIETPLWRLKGTRADGLFIGTAAFQPA